MESCSLSGAVGMYSACLSLSKAVNDERAMTMIKSGAKWNGQCRPWMGKSMKMEAQKEMVHMQIHLIRHTMFRFEDNVSASRSAHLRACSRRLACIASIASACGHRRRWWRPGWRRCSADRQCCGRQVGALGVVRTDGPRAHEWSGRCFNCRDGVAEVACGMSARA